MRRADIQALGELGGELLGVPVALASDLHEGVAGRPFRALGPFALPVRVIHDRVTRTVYSGLRTAFVASARAGAGLIGGSASESTPALVSTPAGARALGFLNGLYGNHLHARENPLAVSMGIRRRGRDIPAAAEPLAEAYPEATPRLAVFVHGLMGDEEWWGDLPLGPRGRKSYGERLQDELGLTPVHVRYNTGLHISDNGRQLSALLGELAAAWPVPVQEIVLVGHSMGGLVTRGACHYGQADGQAWTEAVGHVFCLGTPHLGADLEKGLNALGHVLNRLPETRGLARVVNARSVGIKDLRFGSCVEEDWCDCDPDEYLRDRCVEVPFMSGARYYFIAATLSRGPAGQLLGDLLVRTPSASGRGTGQGRRIPFEVDNGRELSGMTHFHLLNHPAVYDQLRDWMSRPAATLTP